MPTRGPTRHSDKAKPKRASNPFRALAEILWAWKVDFRQFWADKKWGLALRTGPDCERAVEWLELRGFFEYAKELRSRLGGLTGEIVDFYTKAESGQLEDEETRNEAIQIVEDSAKQLAERVIQIQERSRKARQVAHKTTARPNLKQVPTLDAKNLRIQVRDGGKWYPLTDQQNQILDVLFKAKGGWVTGRSFTGCSRPDKTIRRMPHEVKTIIKSNKASGYCIPALLPQ